MGTDPEDRVESGTGVEDVRDVETDDGDATGGYEVSGDERTWGILAHVSAFAGLFVPFGNILGPLLVWLVKRDESRFVDENGRESLNFQITWTLLFSAALLTILVGVGLVLVPIVALAWVILVVLATVRASEEEVYDYPLTIDLVT